MRHGEGEIVVSSGVSPSGKYHLGTLREILTAEAIARELRRRGRTAKHIHVVDDFDVFRKVPQDVPAEFDQYLGKPLCDLPAPDGSQRSYADYFVADLNLVADRLKTDMEIWRSHEQYRAGFFTPAIERALERTDDIKGILSKVSGHKLDEGWSPVQVMEEGYLKNRAFKSIDKSAKQIVYEDSRGQAQTISYADGQVKLNWRIDWPARWWRLGVQAEPFGRDHATKGGSYETGEVIVRDIFQTEPPLPLPYNFINRTGETKKMSKSAGNVVTALGLLDIMPPEIIWYFILRFPPSKQLFFDEGLTLIKLFDDFARLSAKADKTADEQQLIELCLEGIEQPTISQLPFSLLVTSYQASLKDVESTLDVIKRTEYKATAEAQADTIRRELEFIDNWLKNYAPAEVKFDLQSGVSADKFDESERAWLEQLAERIEHAAADAGGDWFHQQIYELKDQFELEPKNMFITLYRLLIGQDHGPRAGWFLATLPREWLIKRLKLQG